MKSLLLFFTLFTLVSISSADEIKFNNGQWLRNVVVVDTIKNVVTVATPNETRYYNINDIEIIIKSSCIPPQFVNSQIYLQDSIKQVEKTYSLKEYPNTPLLVFSVLAVIVGYDYLATAHEYGKEIELMKKNTRQYGSEIAKYETIQSRKSWIGYTLIIGAVANALISLQPIDIEITPSYVTVSYNLP